MTRSRNAFRLFLFFAGVLFYYAVATPIVSVKAWFRRNSTLVPCDRCGKTLFNRDFEEENFSATAGYYVTYPGSAWEKFADAHESRVCDACMFADPRYIAIHGIQKQD